MEEKELKTRAKSNRKSLDEAKKLVSGKKIMVERSFKKPTAQGRGKGKVSAHEKAAMINTIIQKPDVTSKEFAKEYGYKISEGQNGSGSAHRMMTILKNEIKAFDIPEMEDIVKADLIVTALAQREQLKRINERPEEVQMNELTNAANSAFKRARLLSGASTENISIKIEEVKDMKEEDLDSILTEMVTLKEVKK